MIMNEEKGDLFDIPSDYALVHCISEDCAMGAGIAKEFQKRFHLRDKIKKYLYKYNYTYPMTIGCLDYKSGILIFNMITKKNYWDKPTQYDFEYALNELVRLCKERKIRKLAMPRIGCGLDRLQWCWVRKKIEEKFSNMDIEIQVRYL